MVHFRDSTCYKNNEKRRKKLIKHEKKLKPIWPCGFSSVKSVTFLICLHFLNYFKKGHFTDLKIKKKMQMSSVLEKPWAWVCFLFIGRCWPRHGETVREWLQPDDDLSVWSSQSQLQKHVQAQTSAGEVAEWCR